MIEYLKRIAKGEVLSFAQAQHLMALVLDNSVRLEQVGAMLGLLHSQKPTAELLAGFASELGKHRVSVPVSEGLLLRLVDVCGTGGDASGTFNVSTTVAFIAAAAGLPIAKHGNRAVSSLAGSFDVLEALGIGFVASAQEASRALERDHLAFLYAPSFHPALAKIGPIRKALGFRTVFNAMGPLLNPAGVKRQLIGVYARELVVPMAEALHLLGVSHAMVVHGDDGLDEISTSAPTFIAQLNFGQIRTFSFAPASLDIAKPHGEALKGGDAMQNAKIIEEILSGEQGPRTDLVCVNAGAALVVGALASDLAEGFSLAQKAQRSGRALEVLRSLQTASFAARPKGSRP